MNIQRELQKYLKGIGEGTIQPIEIEVGLCSNLQTWLQDYYWEERLENDLDIEDIAMKLIDKMMKWDKATGTTGYIIPHPRLNPETAYNDLPLWNQDAYGNNRRELCLWLSNNLDGVDLELKADKDRS